MTKRCGTLKFSTSVLVALGMVIPLAVQAGGFANLDLGTTRCGMMAIVANIDDATAIYHNPACLAEQKGTRVYFADTNFYLKGRFKLRDKEMNETGWIKPTKFYGISPFLGVTTDFDTEKFVFGMATYVPNAYGAFMPEDEIVRYTLVQGYFITGYVTPTLAYQVTEDLAVAAEMSYVYVNLYGERRMHPAVFMDPLFEQYPDGEEDWRLTINGEEHAFNAGLGLLWKPVDKLRVGLMYTTQSDLTLSGTAELEDVNKEVQPTPDILQQIVDRYGDEFDIETGMVIPQAVRLGFNLAASSKLNIGLDLTWWDYSVYKRQEVTTDPDLSEFFTLSSDKDYSDSYHIDLGGMWHYSQKFHFMLGFQYDVSPIPDKAYSLENPASDLFGYSLGLRYDRNERWRFNVAWVNNYYEKKDIKSVDYAPNIRPIGEGTMYEISFDITYL